MSKRVSKTQLRQLTDKWLGTACDKYRAGFTNHGTATGHMRFAQGDTIVELRRELLNVIEGKPSSFEPKS